VEDLLHIGKNDIIGYAMQKAGIQVTSHSRFECHTPRASTISISAFDPERKKSYFPNQHTFIDEVCSIYSPDTQIIYFSTLRQYEQNTNFMAYCMNKKQDIAKLQKYFDRVSVCYLPNLVCTYRKFHSKFLQTLQKNYNEGLIRFDVHELSSWNFIKSDEIPHKLSLLKRSKDSSILSRNQTQIIDIIKYLSKIKPNLNITINGKIRHYPVITPPDVYYSADNLGKNHKWLGELTCHEN
jgi:hypothetical protein